MQNYEKDVTSEISISIGKIEPEAKTDKSTNSEVISLLDENESIVKFQTPLQKKKTMAVYKSPNAQPPSQFSAKVSEVSAANHTPVSTAPQINEEESDSKNTKKFKKDEHALVMVWRSRTSSPCPSSNSVKSSQFSIGSNLSFKEKKQILQAGAVKHPSIFTMKRLSSMTNSAVSELSSKGSVVDSFANFSINSKPEMIRSSSGLPKFRKIDPNAPPSIKREFQEEEMPGLRKRVCRKVYNIIHKEFQKPKELAKKITLAIEYRINKLTPHHTKHYLKTVKQVFKSIRVSFCNFDFINIRVEA